MPVSPTLIEFDRRNPRLPDLPLEMQIEPVMGCNLRCPMCPVTELPDSMHGRTPTLMSLEIYRRIMDQISDRPRSILLTILGEPLLHPRIVEFITLAKERGHHVALITNGTKLTRALACRLLDARLDVLTMSIDGFTKQTYESLRVGAKHDAVLTNLRQLIEENEGRGRPLRIEINYVVSSRTEPETEAFFREFSPAVHRINFNRITDFGGQFEIPVELVVPGQDPRSISRSAPVMPRSACVHLWRAMFISAEGRMMLCCNDFKLQSGLPTVMEQPLLDVWRGVLEDHRRDHVSGTFESEPCRSCRQNSVPARRPAAVRAMVAWKALGHRALAAAGLVSKPAPFGCVDRPVADSVVSGIAPVQGWALGGSGHRIDHVDVRVDGSTIGTAEWGHFRPDVGEIYPGEEHSFSGFSFNLDTRLLSNGPHTLDLLVTDEASQRGDLGARSVTVSN